MRRHLASGRDTPSRLRLLSLGVVLAGVLTGLVGALVFATLAYSLARAEADTAQLVRVQQIQTNLLIADAKATNAFLVGGLAPPAQQAQYDAALTATGALIAQAARAQPADADALAALNQQVVGLRRCDRAGQGEQPAGSPVGAQYLRAASAQLRADALPIADNLVAANADRAEDRMETWIGLVFVIVAALALTAFIVGQVWLANRFRRTFNRGMLLASVLLLALLAGGVALLLNLNSAVGSIRTGSFADVNTAAGARIEANNAKSNESLTLIARGSGAAFETAWKTSTANVTDDLSRLGPAAPTAEWNTYLDVHKQIRTFDDGGQWEKAVALATGTGPESANTAFSAFDARLADTLDQSSRELAAGLSGAAARIDHRGDPGPAGRPRRRPARPLRRRHPAPGVPMSARRVSLAAALTLLALVVLSACSLFSYAPTAAAQPTADLGPEPVRVGRRARPVRQPDGLLRPQRRPARAGRPAVRRRHRQDQAARPDHRRRLGRHLPAGLPQPVHRPDRGLRHRHGQGDGQGDPRRRERVRAAGDHGRPADPRRCRRARSTWSPAT